MSIEENVRTINRAALICGIGLCLLYIVFLAPHPGDVEGRSFFAVAFNSAWGKPWEWAAAWCSLKMILFSIGLLLVLESIGLILIVLKREATVTLLLVLGLIPCLGFCGGIFCLVKAIL